MMTFSIYKLGGPHLGMLLSTIELNDEYYGTQDIENIQFAAYALGTIFVFFSLSSLRSPIFCTFCDALLDMII